MIKQLVVHVGDSKTGSTSIQATLANNGWTTPTAKAICYPAVLNHINLALSNGKPKQAKMHERGFNRLRKRFLESDADVGVISAEILEFIAP